jgi:KRAB domain-containing zinc finger protein
LAFVFPDFFGQTNNSFQEGKERKFVPRSNLKGSSNLLEIKSEIQQILFSEKMKKSLYKHIPAKNVNDRWFCLSDDCESKGQSFKYIGGLREHFMKKHATEDQKHFPCQICGRRFGTVGLRNRHHQKSHKEEMEYGDSSTDQMFDQQLILPDHAIPLKKENDHDKQQKAHHAENGEYKCSTCDEKFSQQNLLDKHQESHFNATSRATKTREQILFSERKKKRLLKNIPSRNEDDQWYCLSGDCELMGVSFKYIGGLREHYMKKHATENEKLFPCDVCGKRFGTFGLKNRHQKTHENALEFACYSCEQSFDEQLFLDEHIMEYHPIPSRQENDSWYCLSGECESRDQVFKSITDLHDHFMEEHAPEDQKHFPCKVCGKLFGTFSLQKKHQKTYHTDMAEYAKYECSSCDKKFRQLKLFDRHMRTHSTEPRRKKIAPKLFQCDTCGKSFHRQLTLHKHLLVHTEDNSQTRQFFCDQCGKAYKFAQDLREHKERHSDTVIPCELCDMTFKGHIHYRKHFLYKHRLIHECHICHKKFSYQSVLKTHLAGHTGERPYVCDICGASYQGQSSLNSHIASVHEKRQRVKDKFCTMCEKSFYTNSKLKLHMSYHTEERNHVCDECGKSFKVKQHLMHHMESHGNINIQCEHCDRMFNSQTYYQKHLRRKHHL